MEQLLFYILAAVAIVGTILSISEKHAVHAIMYLVLSFFALAVIFQLLGAPLVAAFEVIIYAGAIMVLFLFIIMMLDLGHPEKIKLPRWTSMWPAGLLAATIFASLAALIIKGAQTTAGHPARITIREFSLTLFQKYGIAVEIISLQLLFALVGALYYGRRRATQPATGSERKTGAETTATVEAPGDGT